MSLDAAGWDWSPADGFAGEAVTRPSPGWAAAAHTGGDEMSKQDEREYEWRDAVADWAQRFASACFEQEQRDIDAQGIDPRIRFDPGEQVDASWSDAVLDRVGLPPRPATDAAAVRAEYYAHPESDAAKATAALDAAVRAASPALLARLRALEEVAEACAKLDALPWVHQRSVSIAGLSAPTMDGKRWAGARSDDTGRPRRSLRASTLAELILALAAAKEGA